MKAYRLTRFGGLDGFEMREEPEPSPGRGEVLVRVRAVSLNFRDIAIALERYPWPTRLGLIPTSDAAGEVVEVGEGVKAFKAGDRVISCFHPRWFGGEPPSTVLADSYGAETDGWLAEFKAVSQEAVVRAPASLTFEAASTLPCAGLTAWTALSGPAPIRAGQSVLTQGSGGVSVFALQLARAVGARVIATTSSPAKAERLKALGAAETIDYVREPEWGERARALTGGRGVNRVVEVGGPGTINQSLRAVALGGEIVSIGFLTTDNPGIDFFKLKASGATIRNIAVGDRAGLIELTRVVESAGVNPVIDRMFDFDDAKAAFACLQGGHFGKVVVRC